MNQDLTLEEILSISRLALWGALIALGGWISIPLGPVPITLQTFFVLLCGYMEGPRAFWAVCLYVAAGLLGLPVFAGGKAGPAVLFGPTAGFLISYPLCAAVAGLAKERKKTWPRLALLGFAATLINYGLGSLGLYLALDLSFKAILLILVPFLPGDALKLCAAASLAMGTLSLRRKRAVKGQAIKESPTGGQIGSSG